MKRQSISDVGQIGAWPRYGDTNPRNTILYDAVERYTGRTILDLKNNPRLVLKCKVVHFHWPEKAFQQNIWPTRALIFLVFIHFWVFTRRKIIWTVHNDYREEIDSIFLRKLFFLFTNKVDLFLLPSPGSFRVTRSFPRKLTSSWKLLPLGIYPRMHGVNGGRGSYHLIIGRLTRKKGIYETISRLCTKFPNEEFLVVGKPESEGYGERLQDICSTLDNVNYMPSFVSDFEMHSFVCQCRSVIIDYAEGINSGVATLAISYGRPMFISASKMREDIKKIYGVESKDLKEFPNLASGSYSDLSIDRVAKRFVEVVGNFL